MKKYIKTFTIMVVLVCSLALSTFAPVDLISSTKKGAWVSTPGGWECMGDGNECTIGGGGIVN